MKSPFSFRAAVLFIAMATGSVSFAWALSPDRFYAATVASIWLIDTFDTHGKPLSLGSAVAIGPETLLTNCHVLAKAGAFVVKQGSRSVSARLQYIDVDRDMCQIVAPNLAAPAVPIGNSDRLVIGQKVFTIGTPRGLEQTLSDGLISSLRKDASQHLMFIQISAPISHGSSGGGLFDEDGKLIGITTAGFENGQNLNLAIPINWLRDLPARSAAAVDKYQSQPAAATASGVVASNPGTVSAVSPVPVRVGAKPEASSALPPVSRPVAAPPKIAAISPSLPAVVPPAAAVPSPVSPAPAASVRPPASVASVTPSSVIPPSAPGESTANEPASLPPPASGYADISDIGKLDQFGERKAYSSFLERRFPRAFAIAEGGGSWISNGKAPNPASAPEPYIRVVADCEKYYKRRCHLYAVDGVVVYKVSKS
ncbi:trypsin-like peptidase domain-containing protein [Undibacterium sp. TJN25]|uniref:S1C family serine protease n=1 Tax=Undibacterium sp. TJN25 TaxID=3413056 RepID=UPI003BF44ED2